MAARRTGSPAASRARKASTRPRDGRPPRPPRPQRQHWSRWPPHPLREPTLALAVCTLVLAVTLAVPLGVLAAIKRGTWIDRGLMGFSVLGFSVPVFVIGYVLIYLFAIRLGWLPVQGYQRLADGLGGFLERLILPSITLAIIYI